MNTHGTDRSVSTAVPTARQIKQLGILLGFVLEVVTRIVTRFFFELSPDEAKALLQGKGELSKKLKVALAPVFVMDADKYAAQREYWENFYRTYFGLVADFSQVAIPEKPTDGKWRLIFILKWLNMNAAAFEYQRILVEHNPQWSVLKETDDLDAVIIYNIRTSAESYAIWVRDEQESDGEFRGRSTSQSDPDQLIGVTVLERLVHGVVHFAETKQHLDHKGVTLCSGSRDVDGYIPQVFWNEDACRVRVDLCPLGGMHQDGGVRRAVSLPKAT